MKNAATQQILVKQTRWEIVISSHTFTTAQPSWCCGFQCVAYNFSSVEEVFWVDEECRYPTDDGENDNRTYR